MELSFFYFGHLIIQLTKDHSSRRGIYYILGAGGGSQWREAFILTIDGRRLLRYDPFQSAGHRTISVAAAQITLSAAPSRGIDVQPFRCYNKSTISDTRHHADADGLKGLTGGCIFNFG